MPWFTSECSLESFQTPTSAVMELQLMILCDSERPSGVGCPDFRMETVSPFEVSIGWDLRGSSVLHYGK